VTVGESASHGGRGNKSAWFAGFFLLSALGYYGGHFAWGFVVNALPDSAFYGQFDALLETANLGVWLLTSVVLGLVVLYAVRRLSAPSNAWLVIAVTQGLVAIVALPFYAGVGGPVLIWLFDYLRGPLASALLLSLGAYLGARVGSARASYRTSAST